MFGSAVLEDGTRLIAVARYGLADPVVPEVPFVPMLLLGAAVIIGGVVYRRRKKLTST